MRREIRPPPRGDSEPAGAVASLLVASARAAQRRATIEEGMVLTAASYAGLALLWANGDAFEAARLVASVRGPYWVRVVELLSTVSAEQAEVIRQDIAKREARGR